MSSRTRPFGLESAPKVLSVPRLTTLVSSLIVALASGTNYVYSAYAPQLGSRLRISHTKLNVIGLAGNVGVYSTGPLWGKLVDRRGPRLLLVGAFLLLLTGYSGIRHFYNAPDNTVKRAAADSESLSTFSFWILVICSFFTGAGGNGGLVSSMNATAKSFPDQMRASATGLVISGFGLSAFFFSTIAHVVFPGDISSFLLLLALGTSLPMIFGFFFTRPIPLPPSNEPLDNPGPNARPNERRTSFSELPHDGFAHGMGVDSMFASDAVVYDHLNDSRTNLLSAHHAGEESQFLHEDHDTPAPRPERLHSVELTMAPPQISRHRRSISRPSHGRSSSHVIEVMQDLHGKALFASGDFWLLFVMLSLLSGTGLMYINNVGSISQALFAKGNPDYDEIESAKWQNMQVSIISVANCLGRIFIGLTADLAKNHLQAPRSYCICLVAVLFIFSQAIAINVEAVEGLWYASALLGLAYGGVFGLFPTITIEWFGLSHFSENWGFVSLSPMLGGNLFSLAFGYNLDAHEAPPTDTISARAGLPSGQQCFAGRQCYVRSLYMTLVACTLVFGLSVFAAWKDRQRMTVVDFKEDDREVIWEEDEES